MKLYDAPKHEAEDANNAVQHAGNVAQEAGLKIVDGHARFMSQPHKVRLVSTKDGSPLKNKVKISRNAPCPCNSGKKFKNCHQKAL